MDTHTMFDGVTVRLAEFVHSARFPDLPPSAVHASRRALVNIVGCCLGGAEHEIVETAAKALMPLAGAGKTSVIGRAERADILTATLLNCLSSAAYSFDDTHANAIVHPSGAVATTLLALAEQQLITGEEFVLAFVLGVDVACRLSKAVSVPPASGDIGWSQTGIAAGVGAAVAAAKVLRLEPQGITWAIAIAALQASGFRVAHGTMSTTLIFGHAAQTGLRAAVLAQHGFTGPAAPLEGQYGYASLFSTRPHLAYLTASLGEYYEVEALAYKPYPCGVVIHPAVDAALAWHRSYGQGSASIERVHLHVHPSVIALGFRRHPTGGLEAKVSLYHWVAVALACGRAGIAEGCQQVIDDAAVTHLRNCIEVESDGTLGSDAAVMAVTRRGGDKQTISIAHCRGSVANPMSDEDLNDKFRGQAGLHLSHSAATTLLAECWQIDKLADVADLARLARS